MRIAIAGSSGLLGQALTRACRAAEHEVLLLVRPGSALAERPGAVAWDPTRGVIDAAALEGCGAVVNLAGANLAGKRWTPTVKQELRASRINTAQLLVRTLAGLHRPPQVFLNASAVGCYGTQPWERELDESAPPGEGFLAELVREWEAAVVPAEQYGARVVLARFGVVLSADGGMLTQLVPVFKSGLGGRLGSGAQALSWIALPDAIRAMLFALDTQALAGPVNFTAPQAVTNAQFTHELARALHRPALAALPAPLLRLALGEMAQMLLGGQRAIPRKLEQAGFTFDYPRLAAALALALNKQA